MVYSAALPFGNAVSGLWEDSVVDMIGRYFFQRCPPGPRSSSARRSSSVRRGSVDSCDEPDRHSSYPGQGLELQLLQQALTQQLELRLTEAKASTLQCQVLLLPHHLTTKVGHDVVRTSADEPCGLRGASIKIYVEGKEGLKDAGSILPDPTVTPTFELSVIFKAEQEGGWPPLKHIFETSKVLKLRPEYQLVKRKLYSSASPVIHYSSD